MRSERKVISVISAYLMGSADITERLEPEVARQIIGPAIAAMAEPVEAFGGTVKDFAGDGLLALFGAHQAHEDDPIRAVQAALAMVEAMKARADEVRTKWGVEDFGIRVGVESGLVVLGPVGSGIRVEYGATGDAVNTAARLQSKAGKFVVLVGPATRSLCETTFEWGSPIALELKGKAEAVVAHQALGLRAHANRQRTGLALEARLVGRDAEMAVIESAGARLVAGSGGVVFLIGEAGIGKSRVLAELQSGLQTAAPIQWLEGRCVSYGAALPYFPFRDLLRRWVNVTVMDSEEHLGVALRQAISNLPGAPSDVYPHLAAMLGVPVDGETARMLDSLSPEARRHQINEAVCSVITALASVQPVTLVIEDLHWADGSSIQLIDRLRTLSAEVAVLVIVSHRTEPGHPCWQLHQDSDAAKRSHTDVLLLTALGPESEGDLVDALVGVGTLPENLRSRLVATAGGNPFYLEELVRSLVEGGVLASTGTGWSFQEDVPLEIPPTVERVLIARMDRLSPSARVLAQTAAVLGRQFGRTLLEAVAQRHHLAGDIEELTSFDMVREDPVGSQTYRFKHALLQETAYNNLLKRDRRDIHLRSAHAIESLLADSIRLYYGVLGHHYLAANHPKEALGNFSLAAEESQRVYAVDAAVANFTSALEIAESLDEESATDLRLKRGRVHYQAGHIAEARQDFQQVLEFARAKEDRQREAQSLNDLGFLIAGAENYDAALALLELAVEIAHDEELLEVEISALSRLSVIYTNMLRLDLGFERARAAHALAAGASEESQGRALDALQLVAVLIGDMGTAADVSARLTEIQRRRSDLWYLQFALFQWAWVDLAAARWDRADERLAEGLAINRGIADEGNEPLFGALRCWVARARGDYSHSLELGRESLETSQALGHPEFISLAAQLLAWTMLEVFDFEGAVQLLTLSLDVAEKSGARVEAIRAICHLALVQWQIGEHAEASKTADRARLLWEAIAVPTGHAFLQGADGAIALANLYLLQGQSDRAVELVEPIREAAATAGWHEVVADAELALGMAGYQLDDTVGAQGHLKVALETAKLVGIPGVEWRAAMGLSRVNAEAEASATQAHLATVDRVVAKLAATLEPGMSRHFLTSVRGYQDLWASNHPGVRHSP